MIGYNYYIIIQPLDEVSNTMGLLGGGPPKGHCHFCSGKVISGQNGVHCTQCETFVHADCMKKHGLAEKDSKLLRSDRVYLRCPSCHHEGKVKI